MVGFVFCSGFTYIISKTATNTCIRIQERNENNENVLNPQDSDTTTALLWQQHSACKKKKCQNIQEIQRVIPVILDILENQN